jgi:tetratricopeptide (TPR) repeat protein/TolB-like protein
MMTLRGEREQRRLRLTIFYSYSHKDEGLRDELEKHLLILKRAGLIQTWHDRRILPGEEWDGAIKRELSAAHLILLLISVDFLASEYCQGVEVRKALERHRKGAARVIPVLLRPVLWTAGTTPLSKFQALPADGRPVTLWPSLDLAFQNICEGILKVVVAWSEEGTGNRLPRVTLFRRRRVAAAKRHERRKRVLDAGFPSRVAVGTASVLLVMVRRSESQGLRAILDLRERYDLAAEDVVSTPTFQVEFPSDAYGGLYSSTLTLEVESPDFAPPRQRKELEIPPRGDSAPCVFLLTPLKSGKLWINLEVRDGEHVRSRSVLSTHAAAPEGEELYTPRLQASVAFEVSGDAPEIKAPEGAKPRRRKLIPLLAACPVIVAALALFLPGRMAGPTQIAVLPFRAVTGQAEQEDFAAGLHASVVAQLSRAPSLRVSSVAEVRSARAFDPRTAARELGADLIVSGELDRRRELLLLNVVNARTGAILRSDTLNASQMTGLALEESIARTIAREAGARNLPQSTASPGDSEAHRLYLMGRGALNNAQDPEDLVRARSYFERALQQSPGLSLASAGLADTLLAMYRRNRDVNLLHGSLKAAQQALRGADALPEVHLSLANVYGAMGKHGEAIAAAEKAVALAPYSDDGYRRLAGAYLEIGRIQDAVKAIEKATEIAPEYWMNYYALGHMYLRSAEYAESESSFRRAIGLVPYRGLPHEGLGAAYLGSGRYHEAIKELRLATELGTESYSAYANLASAYRMTNQNDQARAQYEKAIALASREVKRGAASIDVMKNLALYYARAGDSQNALRWIKQARAAAPGDASVVYVEAIIHSEGGRFRDSISALREALQKGYPASAALRDRELGEVREQPEFQALAREKGAVTEPKRDEPKRR